MKKLAILSFAFFVSQSFGITLDQVKSALKANIVSQDSVEMNLRISVKAPGVYQQTDIYLINKGPSKSYTEIKSNFLKQRSIVNGNKMKIVDLKTNKTQVIDYNGDVLTTNSYANFNPLDSGEWSEPKFFSDNIYTIQGSTGTVHYNKKMKRIEKIEAIKNGANTLTKFSYDANNNMKKMEVSVIVNGTESVVTTEILRMQKSDNVPDTMFEF